MLETGHLLPRAPAPTAVAAAGDVAGMMALAAVGRTLNEPPAQGVAGPSAWYERAGDDGADADYDYYPYIGRRRRGDSRKKQTKRSLWSSPSSSSPFGRRGAKSQPVFADHSVINDHGAFNGSCANTQLQSSPLHTMEGTCASYYPDITAYCCSGVRGTLVTVPWGMQGEESVLSSNANDVADTTSADEPVSRSTTSATAASATSTPALGAASSEEPLCETTDYADILACFKLTAETNCKAGQSGLFGLCNSAGQDTSTVTTSLASESSGAGGGVAAATANWKLRWAVGVAVVAFVVGGA